MLGWWRCWPGPVGGWWQPELLVGQVVGRHWPAVLSVELVVQVSMSLVLKLLVVWQRHRRCCLLQLLWLEENVVCNDESVLLEGGSRSQSFVSWNRVPFMMISLVVLLMTVTVVASRIG